LGVARKLDVLAALIVVVRKHRVGNHPCVGRRLSILLSARLDRLDAFLIRVTRLTSTSCRIFCRLLLRHTARLGLLLPVALRLVDRLLDRRCFILLAQVLTHRHQAGIYLKLTVQVAVGRRNRADALVVLDLDRPHLDFTRGRLAVQGGKGRNSRHCLLWMEESVRILCTHSMCTKHPDAVSIFSKRVAYLCQPKVERILVGERPSEDRPSGGDGVCAGVHPNKSDQPP